MKELVVKGFVRLDMDTDQWTFETNEQDYSADMLSGIDELLEENGIACTCQDEEIEIVIRLKDR